MADEDEFLTVAEIAQRFKVNEQTVRNWIDRGELIGVRLGSRRVRVRESELQRFIAESSSAPVTYEIEMRDAVHDAYSSFQFASSAAAEAVALRRLARAANLLARSLGAS